MITPFDLEDEILPAGPYMIMVDVRWNNIAEAHAILKKVNICVKASVGFSMERKSNNWGLSKLTKLFKDHMRV